jgi:hypothetical protein
MSVLRLAVWDEHTLNQGAACMAKLKQLRSEALARNDALQSGASVGPSRVECPACSKPYAEHAESGLLACASKFSTEESEFESEFVEASFKVEEPDPVKRAELEARTLQIVCSCGKTLGEHSVEEILSCDRRQRGGNAGGGV